MIRSMTAFALREASSPWGVLACELRSVNHRYLELSLRLPDELRAIEPKLRELVASRISRGKVDATLKLRGGEARLQELKLNRALAAELVRLSNEIKAIAPDLAPGTRFEALSWPGLILEPEADVAGQHDAALALFDAAFDEFIATRDREGGRLLVVMQERIDAIESIVADIRGWLPGIRQALRAKLDAKLAELKLPLDPGRLEQELVLSLQKLDVDEELDRLAAHVAEARRILGRSEAAGRRLDFLLQEFNREANTLGSKSVDPRTSQACVELKVLIEQLREQVQNIE
ncbi:MAG TPA: YicC/YloC family endoribonuclease [Candidatus Saccharimonadia bacterium]|nr:YicC/YloC family endoribonuclease [Candidatus Saccharimonadia bacterium]